MVSLKLGWKQKWSAGKEMKLTVYFCTSSSNHLPIAFQTPVVFSVLADSPLLRRSPPPRFPPLNHDTNRPPHLRCRSSCRSRFHQHYHHSSTSATRRRFRFVCGFSRPLPLASY